MIDYDCATDIPEFPQWLPGEIHYYTISHNYVFCILRNDCIYYKKVNQVKREKDGMYFPWFRIDITEETYDFTIDPVNFIMEDIL